MHNRLFYCAIITLTSIFFRVSSVCGQPTEFETAEQEDTPLIHSTYLQKNTDGKNVNAAIAKHNVTGVNSTSPVDGQTKNKEEHPTESIEGSGVTVGRVALETLGGLGGVFVSFSIGMSLGFAVASDECEECGSLSKLGDAAKYGLIAGGVLTSVAVPLGVYLLGNQANGSGGYGWTMLGHMAGAAVGWSAAVPLFITQEETLVFPTAVFVVLLHLSGAILGYECSSDDNYDGTKVERPLSILSVKPALFFLPNKEHAVFGIMGFF